MELITIYKTAFCHCFTVMILVRQTIGENEMDYLKKYGYIDQSSSHSGNLVSEDYFKQAVKSFQKMAGLPVTGILDKETKTTMTLPRCGNTDTVGTGNRARKKRYALHGSKWPKQEITYRIVQYSRKLSVTDIERELQRAFDLWSAVIPIRFTKRDYGYADIEIKFVSGHHRDNTPFDGNGQTLAHAYFPQYGGDAHFDEDERWTVNIPEGVNLFQVAAHEFGHSLGLAHSDERSALMAPFYRGYDKNFKLDQDDIMAVQELYGSRAVYSVPTRPPDIPFVHIPNICRNATIDAITRTEDGNTYVFQGSSYYRLDEKGFDNHQYPRPVEDWADIKGPIDAALTWPNGWTFLFKGTQYWKFHNLQPIYGPKNISEGFDGIPGDLDAAFVWSGNGKTYFVKGRRYWRYYGNRVDYDYPRSLSVWNGLPTRISAAFQWQNGRTYFFSGREYYRYNDQLFNVDSGGYPRETSIWWLGCPDRHQIAAHDRDNRAKSDVRFGSLNGERGSEEQWITVQDTGYSSGLHDDPSNGSCRTINLYIDCTRALLITFYAWTYLFLINR